MPSKHGEHQSALPFSRLARKTPPITAARSSTLTTSNGQRVVPEQRLGQVVGVGRDAPAGRAPVGGGHDDRHQERQHRRGDRGREGLRLEHQRRGAGLGLGQHDGEQDEHADGADVDQHLRGGDDRRARRTRTGPASAAKQMIIARPQRMMSFITTTSRADPTMMAAKVMNSRSSHPNPSSGIVSGSVTRSSQRSWAWADPFADPCWCPFPWPFPFPFASEAGRTGSSRASSRMRPSARARSAQSRSRRM